MTAPIEQPIRSDDPRISVVIPTIPRNDHQEVVEYLESQDTDVEYEVIIVNDASLDICEARNAGIEAASADVVALTDDDCRPPRQWLDTLARVFERNPDAVCIEGRVIGGRTYDGVRKYVGCNLAFRRDAALGVGGFRSAYAGWRDDTEFGWRMEERGRCLFSREAVMNHPPRPRASIDAGKEKRLKGEYPGRYEDVIVPDTLVGRVNDWFWRNGIWDAIDGIRYRGEKS